MLFFKKNGKIVQKGLKGNSDLPMLLTISKRGGEYIVTMDGEVILKHTDPKPIRGKHKFSIGGFFSRLYLGDVRVVDLTAGSGKKPPTKAAETAKPAPGSKTPTTSARTRRP